MDYRIIRERDENRNQKILFFLKHIAFRFNGTLVLAEHTGDKLNPITLSAVSAASKLGEISVLVAGTNVTKIAEQVAKVEQVKRVFIADHEKLKHQLPEYVAKAVETLQKQYKFDHVVAGASTFGRDVLPRVAAQFDASPVTDIIAIHSDDTFSRPTYAGNAICKVKSNAPVKFLTFRGTAFKSAKESGGSGKIEKAPETDFSFDGVEFLSQELLKSERPDLQSAKVVVSGGRAVGSADNFKMIYELADKLKAAVGASRAAVDAGYVSNELQIGQTGKELYIAIGISGAIQHTAGMKDSKVIVAINKDPDAPIFEIADIGLKADLHKAVPELIKAL
ncbi:electron transfer flavoprotein FAD-binding domain protein [Onchocerca flexuosa]|uniref:Electron transfer flavoprotein subunit alpha n=1 Tax=Onchocerca flexuosa TaxID=387005 RepID=A0A238BQI4_9BILA|nr:electron transfer flavoprotein FAD-binding domain protein [Onchocerca flexuosa]